MSHSQNIQGPHGQDGEAGGASGWGRRQANQPTETNAALDSAPGSSRAPRRERRRLRTVLALSLTALAAAITALALLLWGAYEWKQMLDRERALSSQDDGDTRRAGLPAEEEAEEKDGEEVNEPPLNVPRETEVHREGSIVIVDLGIEAPSLRDVLHEQRRLATTLDQSMVVMLSGRRCGPCRGVEASLSDPRMQEALAAVRLVRVDLEVFGDELRRMHLPTNLYPAFFLLHADLTPRDAIHGGEWDEDVPENIAPVLGGFVRGELKERRHIDWSPTTTSIPL